MRKIYFFLLFLMIFLGKIGFSYALSATNLYYYDDNKNQKVDRIRIEFDSQISGSIDFSKIQLYSNTGGLATFKINSLIGYFSGYIISGSLLDLLIIEQDNLKTSLNITNTTTSDLRLKSLDGLGITDLSGNPMTKLSLTSSFNNYNSANIFNKTDEILNSGDNLVLDNTGTTNDSGSGEILSQTGRFISSGSIVNISNSGATLSGVIIEGTGNILISYGINSFSFSGVMDSSIFTFSNLQESSSYNYKAELFSGSGDLLDSFTGGFSTSSIPLLEQKLYYFDKNSNGKIDSLELEYNKTLTGTLDLNKIKIYSNTGGLATFQINTLTGIISNFYLSGNILGLNLAEQDNLKINLNITNTTASDLRLKSLSGIGILDLFGNEITALSLTSSFENYKSSNIFNMTNSGVISDSGSIDNSNSSSNSEIAIPEIIIDFQSPSYVLDNGLNSYKCDKSKGDCKVNFSLINSFTGSFSESDYRCEIDFGFNTGEENDCNPSSVVFGSGVFDVKFRIIDKANSSNYREKIIQISNIYEPIAVPNPVITIQSGLSNFSCNSPSCSVNFTGENSFNNDENNFNCSWDFGFVTGEENDCNPSYVHFGPGNYTIKFKIIDKQDSLNFKETSINISNIYQAGGVYVSQVTTQTNLNSLKAIITLQGTIGKTKKQSGNNLYCYVDDCSINFTAEHSLGENLSYFWDFGNGITSDLKNPKSLTYKKGDYKIVLKIRDNLGNTSEDYFNVSVLGDDKIDEIIEEKLVEKITLDPNISQIKISRINANPYGSDDFEWIELENLTSANVSLIGCQLDDNIGKGSSKSYKFKNEYIGAKSTKKFYKIDTGISLNNNKDSVNFVCNSDVFDTISWDYNVPDGYIISKDKKLETESRITVVRVIDGDTIIVLINGKEEKVRLLGVDTPESVHPYKKVEFYAKNASNFTRQILEGKEIKLEYDTDIYDKYGRILAYVWIDGIMFNKTLIEKGYARPYLRYNFKYLKEFEKLGQEAKKNKVGMWADKQYVKILEAEIKEDKLALINKIEEENKDDIKKQLEEILAITDKEIFDKKMQKFLKKYFKIVANKSQSGTIIITGKTLENVEVSFEISSNPLPEEDRNKVGNADLRSLQGIQKSENVGFANLQSLQEKASLLSSGAERSVAEGSLKHKKDLIGIDLPAGRQVSAISSKGQMKIFNGQYIFAFAGNPNNENILKYSTISDENGEFHLILDNLLFEDFTIKTYVKYLSGVYLVDEVDFNKEKIKTQKIKKEETTKNKEEFNILDYKIIIQGKTSKDKIIGDSSIFCKTKKYCSINFTLFGTENKNLIYLWDFGNNEEFIGFNPKSIHYYSGKYNLVLKIMDFNYNELININYSIVVEKILPKVKKKKVKKQKEFLLNFSTKEEVIENNLGDKEIALSGISLSFLFLMFVYLIVKKNENHFN